MDIDGNTLVFTDQHFGVKNNSPLRQKICALVVKKLLEAIDKHSIDNIIFCGDFFHQRNALTIDTLNIAYRCLSALARRCKTYMILGNHDLFNKNSIDINSINIFRNNANVVVVDKPLEASMNGARALLVPWLADLSAYKPETYDFMFGHFDISSKFLMASYREDHANASKTSSAAMDSIDSSLGNGASSKEELEKTIGNFIDLAKRDTGTIFAGHIHGHKEMVVKGRNFIFVGSPYQQNLGDINCRCGYYAIDKINQYSFYEIDGLPKHVQIRCGDVMAAGIDKFDFSIASKNIVQKIYDIDIGMEDDIEISKKISAAMPYEELLPEYQVDIDFSKNDIDDISNSRLIDAIRQSKLDYVKDYIAQLDANDLKASGIDKDKLYTMLERYYNDVAGN